VLPFVVVVFFMENHGYVTLRLPVVKFCETVTERRKLRFLYEINILSSYKNAVLMAIFLKTRKMYKKQSNFPFYRANVKCTSQ